LILPNFIKINTDHPHINSLLNRTTNDIIESAVISKNIPYIMVQDSVLNIGGEINVYCTNKALAIETVIEAIIGFDEATYDSNNDIEGIFAIYFNPNTMEFMLDQQTTEHVDVIFLSKGITAITWNPQDRIINVGAQLKIILKPNGNFNDIIEDLVENVTITDPNYVLPITNIGDIIDGGTF